MMELSCDPLALTTAVNTLAVSLAARLNDEDLELTAALLVQLGETLETISVQRRRTRGGRERLTVPGLSAQWDRTRLRPSDRCRRCRSPPCWTRRHRCKRPCAGS